MVKESLKENMETSQKIKTPPMNFKKLSLQVVMNTGIEKKLQKLSKTVI